MNYILIAFVMAVVAFLLAANIGPCFHQTAMFWIFVGAVPFVISAATKVLQRARPDASPDQNLRYSALGLLVLQGGWLVLNLFYLHLYSGMCFAR